MEKLMFFLPQLLNQLLNLCCYYLLLLLLFSFRGMLLFPPTLLIYVLPIKHVTLFIKSLPRIVKL